MYAKVESLGLNGLDAFSVTVEADISTGLPGLTLWACRIWRCERVGSGCGLPLRTGATSSRCPV